MIDGLQNGELIVIASQSLADSATLALSIVEHFVLRDQVPVAVFSLRMSGADIVRHMASSFSGIELHRLRTGGLNSDEWLDLGVALGKLRAAPLHVHSQMGLSALTLRVEARRLSRKIGNLGLIVIDALELLQYSGRDGEDATASHRSCQVLKMIAQELQCPVIVLTHISQTEKMGQLQTPGIDAHPMAMPIRDLADTVLTLQRNASCQPELANDLGSAVLNLSKPQNGFTGKVRLMYSDAPLRFRNCTAGDGGGSSVRDRD